MISRFAKNRITWSPNSPNVKLRLKHDGYLAAFPTGAFDRLEGKRGDGGGVVVPYYTIHKIMAGLLDAHHYLGNEQERAFRLSVWPTTSNIAWPS